MSRVLSSFFLIIMGRHVVGIDVDSQSLEIASANAEELEVLVLIGNDSFGRLAWFMCRVQVLYLGRYILNVAKRKDKCFL